MTAIDDDRTTHPDTGGRTEEPAGHRTEPPRRAPTGRPARTPARSEPSRVRSTAVLAGLLVGLPLLALPAGGPRQLLEAAGLLTGRPSETAVAALLQLVLWVLWAQLASCTVVEALSARAGHGLPARVPYAFAGQQRFVRRHLTAVVPARQPAPPDPEPVAAAPSLRAQAAAVADQVKDSRTRSVSPRWDLADAPLLAAGLLDALADGRRRHRQLRPVGAPVPVPDPEAAAVEVAARLGADPAGAGLLDAALRHLTASWAAAGAPPPRLLAARVLPAELELVLETARDDLPRPWVGADSGRRWSLPRDVEVPPVAAAAPAPALVCLGGDGLGRVLLDLEAAQGVVCVTGDFDAVRSVVVAAALELITARWADDHTVTLVGFGDTPAPLGGRRVRCVATLAEVTEEITDRLSAGRQYVAALGGGVSAPELRAAGGPAALAAARPEIVVLARPPQEAELAELTGWFRAAPQRAPLSILVAGPVPDATWELPLDADGVLTLSPLDHKVGAQAVSPRTYAALGRLARLSAPTAAETPDAAGDPDGEPLLSVDRPYDRDAVRVLIRLFGRPEATGDIGPGDPISLEIATYLALRGPATTAELTAAVWPGGVGDEERNRALRRARWWLGLDATGEPRLGVGDGRLTLSPEVQTDWAAALSLPAADAALRATPGLLRDEPVSPWPPTRFGWLAAEPLTHRIDTAVADRCARAAADLLAAGDRAAAVELVVAGLRVCPHATVLWLLLDAAAQAGDREMIRAVRDRRLAGLRF